jgi:hypothetical protein
MPDARSAARALENPREVASALGPRPTSGWSGRAHESVDIVDDAQILEATISPDVWRHPSRVPLERRNVADAAFQRAGGI